MLEQWSFHFFFVCAGAAQNSIDQSETDSQSQIQQDSQYQTEPDSQQDSQLDSIQDSQPDSQNTVDLVVDNEDDWPVHIISEQQKAILQNQSGLMIKTINACLNTISHLRRTFNPFIYKLKLEFATISFGKKP